VTLSIDTLFTAATAEAILARGLEVARAVGLVVSSWRVGDPTRAAFKFLAEVLENHETIAAQFAKSAFLSTSEGDWKTVVAKETYGVERPAASYATSTVSLLNSGGGWYDVEAGDLTVASSLSGATYHNLGAISLHGAGATDSAVFEADVEGSEGAAGADEIDSVVTSLLGVTVTGSTVAIASDAASDPALDTLCEASLGALSPNGPPEAYEYVALNSELTGTTEITRAQSSEDSATGAVTLWLASAVGAVSDDAVIAAQAAIDVWATPLGITPTAQSALEDSTDCTATIAGSDLPADAVAKCEAAYAATLAVTPIGGLLSRSAIISAMQVALVNAGATNVSVSPSLPAADVSLAAGHIPIVGSVSISE